MRSRQIAFGLGASAMCGMLIYRWFSHMRQDLAGHQRETDKFKDNFQLLSHWLEVKNDGGSAAEYFRERGYRRIAVYGMGELANRLCEELEGTDIEVAYGIDRDVCNTISRMDTVYSPDDSLQEVDAVIVTPFYAMDSIRRKLSEKVKCPVISLEEAIWSL